MPQGLRFATAREVFDAFPTVGDDVTAQPTDDPVLDYVRTLLESSTPENAVTFCAYLLRRRVAVWWAHQCLSGMPALLGPEDQQMLALAEAWVREPEEEERNEALTAAMDAPTKTPGTWVALGAGWSGGSMLPPDLAPVSPPAHLTPKAVNAAVLGMLARVPHTHRAECLRGFVDMAIHLAASE